MSFPTYPEYKDSGVEWLGDVPSHWIVSRLKWYLLANDGGTWGVDPDGSDDTIVLRSTEQTIDGNWRIDDPALRKLSCEEKKYTVLLKGDLLLTKSSGSALHIGKTTLVDDYISSLHCCYSNFMQRIRTNSSFIANICWYILNSYLAREQLGILSNCTTGLANINGKIIDEILVPVAPSEEQTNIIAFLDHETAKIDALIAEQETLIALLKEKRQAVISHVVTKGLDPNAPMKDSGVAWLGDIPTHWDISPIKYAIQSIEQGWSPQCENFPVEGDEEWGVLKVGCVNGGKFNPLENKAFPKELEPQPSLGLLEGDVLISRANTKELVGSAAVVDTNRPRLLLCDKLYRLRTHTKQILPVYLVMLLGTREARSIIELSATGASSSMQNIGQSTILKLEIPLPSIDEQESIVHSVHKQCEPLESLLTEAQYAITLLKERRSALISAAVTGKIDVRGYAPQPEAA